jgi:hypothetical protein
MQLQVHSTVDVAEEVQDALRRICHMARNGRDGRDDRLLLSYLPLLLTSSLFASYYRGPVAFGKGAAQQRRAAQLRPVVT